MSYQTLTQYNATGLEGLFLYTNSVAPVFLPLMLFALWIIVLLGTFFSSKRLTGRGDFSASMAASSFITLIVSLLMTLVPGLISGTIVAIVFAIFIISVIILFVSRE